MKTEHPIIPPPELVRKWQLKIEYCGRRTDREAFVAKVFQLGADYELDDCCEWISMHTTWDANRLRTARRSKPPSLKEQALQALAELAAECYGNTDKPDTIRRALEKLDD